MRCPFCGYRMTDEDLSSPDFIDFGYDGDIDEVSEYTHFTCPDCEGAFAYIENFIRNTGSGRYEKVCSPKFSRFVK